MGCDIHFFVEKYSDEDFDGPKDVSEERSIKLQSVLKGKKSKRWISADVWKLEEVGTEDEHWNVPYGQGFYHGRNYYLFSILADVRNYGSDKVKPISAPKGIPKNASDGYKYTIGRWDGDGHSHSYFTLSQLMRVNWSKYNKDWISGFLETIQKMKELDPDPKKVRVVFFFDN